jgi:hypothetical protein
VNDFDITYRVLVTGARGWWSQQLPEILGIRHRWYGGSLVIIHGAEPTGIDHQADAWCIRNGVQQWAFPALWNNFKQAGLNVKWAGNFRNSEMLVMAQPHVVLAFHYDLSQSKGTKDMIAKAERLHVPVEIYTE